jgi:hypothetical protein
MTFSMVAANAAGVGDARDQVRKRCAVGDDGPDLHEPRQMQLGVKVLW